MSSVVCGICPHACKLSPGQLGICRARIGALGAVQDQNYGRITSLALDPIEKKPLARYMPDSKVLSVGSYGCNMRCAFCQNSSIACAGENDVAWRSIMPADLAAMAQDMVPQGNIGVAFTYNEPFIGYEFLRDTASLLHEADLKSVVVSNGLVNPEPLAALLPLIDAANIDLKAFSEETYRQLGGSLECTKRTIEAMARCDTCHLEVTMLIVPGMNDTAEETEAAAAWLASLSPDIPYHISRFFPCHEMRDRAATDVESVYGLADVARRYLKYVYTGNC